MIREVGPACEQEGPDPSRSIAARLARLEANNAVRAVATRYFRLCDALGPTTQMDELGDLFAQDAVWEGKGRYEEAFGRHEGRDAILAMLGSYATSGHFILNAHYLTSEDIVILDDRTAMASWQMLQVSTYHDGKSDFRSASLNLEFAVRDGSWRITRFVTQAIFSRAVGPWNDDTAISVPTASTITLENEDTEK